MWSGQVAGCEMGLMWAECAVRSRDGGCGGGVLDPRSDPCGSLMSQFNTSYL